MISVFCDDLYKVVLFLNIEQVNSFFGLSFDNLYLKYYYCKFDM